MNIFKEYLKENNYTYRSFAKAIGTTHVSVVNYAYGRYSPNKKTMQRIYEVTNGLVTPDSFILNDKDRRKLLTEGKQDLERLQEIYKKHQRQVPLKILSVVMKGDGERDYSLSGVSRKINGSLLIKDFEMQRLKDFYKEKFNEDF